MQSHDAEFREGDETADPPIDYKMFRIAVIPHNVKQNEEPTLKFFIKASSPRVAMERLIGVSMLPDTFASLTFTEIENGHIVD